MKKGKWSKSLICIAWMGFLFIFTSMITYADVPQYLSFQGKLLEDGTAITGYRNVTFSIWDNPSGGNPASALWHESQVVHIIDGIYNVQLGAITSLPGNLHAYNDLYLQVDVIHPSQGSQRLTPLMPFNSNVFTLKAAEADNAATADSATTAYTAINAGDADTVDGQHGSYYLNWDNITNVPSGFSDGIDNDSGGDITSVSAGTGLSGGGVSGNVTLNVDVPLTLSGSDAQGVVYGTNSYASGGYGVYGFASATTGANSGVHGRTASTSGRGVYGYATAASGNTYGVRGDTSSTSGRGVYGLAGAATGETYGVYGHSSSSDGRGVYGNAAGSSGRGVEGYASNAGDVQNYGGYFESMGSTGIGVYGKAEPDGYAGQFDGNVRINGTDRIGVGNDSSLTIHRTGIGLGLLIYNYDGLSAWPSIGHWGLWAGTGSDDSNLKYGVTGYARGLEGVKIGVRGTANDNGGTNYGGSFEAEGPSAYGVYGEASYTGNVENYGGYFLSRGERGRGVYSETEGDNGIGVWGNAPGINATGVWGDGGNWDFYAAGPGTNYGPFTGAHEVRLSQDFLDEVQPGMIVSVTGQTQLRCRENGTPSLSSTLPTVKLSSRAADKAVFGVLIAEAPLPEDHWYKAQEGERFAKVNALGEGRVWVSNINGNIEVGDYITTSLIPGYGQRQDDDLLHSYTLGKVIETVNWDSVTEVVEINGQLFKVYLIAVVYTSG